MSLIKKLAGETVIYGMSSIVARLMNYLLVPFLSRIFETTAYGEVLILYSYVGILMVLYTYRFETAFFRFGSRNGNLEKAFSTASISLLGTTALLTATIFLFLHPIAAAAQFAEHPEYIGLFAGILAFDALAAIPFARLRLENRPIKFALIKTLGILIYIFFVVLFLKIIPLFIENGQTWLMDYYDEELKVTYVIIANLLQAAISFLLLSPLYLKIKWVFDRDIWQQMFRYAVPLIVVGFAGVVNQLIALPLLERLLPYDLATNRSQAGIYGVVAKLAILMNLFTQAFNYAAEPFFFKNANRADAKKVYAQVAHAFTLVGCLAFLGIMLYIDIIQYFLGKNYREGLEIVPILLMAYLFLGLYYNFSIWYKLTDKTHFGAYISIGGVVITLIINFTLIPNPAFGYYGAAWAAFACYFFMAIAGYWTGQRHHPIPYPLKRMFFWIGLSVGIYLLSEWGRPFLETSFYLKMGVHTLLLVAFVGLIYGVERGHLRAM